MKKITAIIVCAAFAFAACTKTTLPEPDAGQTPVEETNSGEELKLNLTITRADGLGGDAPDTKAIKAGWETGDVIMVFFKTDVHKYLELKYDGASWIGTRKNGLTEGDITGASLKKLRAIHLPHNQSVRPEPGITSYNMLSYYDYFLESGLVDYTYSSTGGLTATLRMAAPQYTDSSSGKLIDFQVTGFDPSRTYHLNMKYLRKLYVSGVSHSALELWYGAYGLDRDRLIQGRKDGSAMHFTGLLDQSAVGTPITFDFTILDQKNKIAYTRSVGPKTVNGNLSVDLGDISDESKWKATPYEDMGIDNADGKRMYWARRNLGATSDYDPGLYFAWGQTTGYPRILGANGKYSFNHSFSESNFSFPELDENNYLKPAYDAAYVVLGGAWRMPTSDEWRRLWDDTEHGYTQEDLNNSVRAFCGKKSGYTNNSFYLPHSSNAFGSDLSIKNLDAIICWTPEYKGKNSLGSETADIFICTPYVPINIRTLMAEYGTPIRPVFTLQ